MRFHLCGLAVIIVGVSVIAGRTCSAGIIIDQQQLVHISGYGFG